MEQRMKAIAAFGDGRAVLVDDVPAPVIGPYESLVKVRSMTSRWGSCSSRRNLNFNWKLIMAPPQALDYVVLVLPIAR